MGFNRTFMELKYKFTNETYHEIYGFNRTFMELKFPCVPADRER